LSSRLLGFVVLALGLIGLAWRDFDLGQPVPAHLPGRWVLACAADVFMVLAGAALQWRRTRAWGAGALAIYYSLIVVVLMYGHLSLKHYREYGLYSGAAEQLALAAGAAVLLGLVAALDPATRSRLISVARRTFGVCAILFGGAHFVYLNLTVPLIPKWLPPNPEFWAYATGLAHIAAGIAIVTEIKARLASILLTIMFASFTPLVHLPMLIADPANHSNLSENALNLALVGAAWLIADSLAARPKP
jgi:uncharacterized membrane protein YphA (DoxX/SURF4 family)